MNNKKKSVKNRRMEKLDLRMTRSESKKLDQIANMKGVSRSQAARMLMFDNKAFWSLIHEAVTIIDEKEKGTWIYGEDN